VEYILQKSFDRIVFYNSILVPENLHTWFLLSRWWYKGGKYVSTSDIIIL